MLKRTPGTPPPILPTKAVDRPLWSIMIPVYNCGRFLPQALNSVLIQFQHNEQVQIEVVDDASTDLDVQSLVSEIGGGRIGYYRQPYNVGSLRNFETCINRSTGKYIHLLHGDDYLSPGFYAEVERLFEQFPEAGSLCTGFTQVTECGKFICNSTIQLSEPGIIENWLEQIACNQKLQPPAVVVKREVYEELGSFFAVHYGEDWLMWVRIAAAYPVVHSPKKLAHYRVHDSNISSDALISGQHIKDIRRVIDLMQEYLPGDKRAYWKKTAEKNWSIYFAETTDKTYGKYHQYKQALTQARLAMQLNLNPTTLFYLVKTWSKNLIGWKMRKAGIRML